MATRPSRTISIAIEQPFEAVYAFAAEPRNFARWAAGLGSSLRRTEEGWIAAGADGPVRIRFSEPNAYGVLDHWVTLPSGAVVDVPLRVVANGDGCEVMLTLFRQPGMTDEGFEVDAASIERDLSALKRLLESGAPAEA